MRRLQATTSHAIAMQSTAPTAPAPRHEPGRPRQRVALCEPDALLRELLAEWLHRGGFEPVHCPGSAPADNVILVVADLPAPREDGVACIAALRQSFPGARVLAISGKFSPGMHGTTSASVELGAGAVLAKPFGAEVFIEAVRALLEP
jgi:DNA-binding response OmpR family regulator